MEQALVFFQTSDWEEQAQDAVILGWESGRYPNDEQWVRVLDGGATFDESVVYARFTAQDRLDDQWFRLMLLLSGVKKISTRVKLVLPYLPYSLQEREGEGNPVAAVNVVTAMLGAVGVDELVAYELHCPKLAPTWPFSVTELFADDVLADALRQTITGSFVVVAPDAGAEVQVRRFAKQAGNAPVVILNKKRLGPGQVVLDGDLSAQPADTYVMVDDILNTGGTLLEAAKLIHTQRPEAKIVVVVTHGLYANSALKKLEESSISRVLQTDSFVHQAAMENPLIQTVSLWPVLQ